MTEMVVKNEFQARTEEGTRRAYFLFIQKMETMAGFEQDQLKFWKTLLLRV
jgi:hypothetical protein